MTVASIQRARGTDSERVGIHVVSNDVIRWRPFGRVDKFSIDQVAFAARKTGKRIGYWEDEPKGADLFALCGAPELGTVESEGNLLTTIGCKRVAQRLIAIASNQGLDSTHTRIGVGNGSTAAAIGDTDLSASAGSGNRQFVLVDSAPTNTNGAMTFVATHTTGLSNFAWSEWGIDGGTANGTTVTSDANTTPGLVNRKVISLGTKTSSSSWVFTCTITIS